MTQEAKIKSIMEPYIKRAQYYETDQMGVVHHSNYIRWFEEARVDMMDKMGYPYARLEEDGLISPVIGVGCEYKTSVKFNDHVKIYAAVTFCNGVKMTVSYRIYDAESNDLKAYGETRHCFINGKGRPQSIKKAIPHAYELFAGSMVTEEELKESAEKELNKEVK